MIALMIWSVESARAQLRNHSFGALSADTGEEKAVPSRRAQGGTVFAQEREAVGSSRPDRGHTGTPTHMHTPPHTHTHPL